MESKNLHIFFLPFFAPGHMIPLVDMARLFAARSITCTVITTTDNAPLILPSISGTTSINLLTIPFPFSQQNITSLPTPEPTPSFLQALNTLETPVKTLIQLHQPDCIISDAFFPWSSNLRIPRIICNCTSIFCSVLYGIIHQLKLHETVSGDDELFLIPGLPHQIKLTRRTIPEFLLMKNEFTDSLGEAHRRSYGVVNNSFFEMEREYMDLHKKSPGIKVWSLGPVSACNEDSAVDKAAARGGKASVDISKCLAWLDEKKPRSVLYVCFGSLCRFTEAQLEELAAGLHGSGHPFIWVVKEGCSGVVEEGEGDGWIIIKGWAPQMVILNHEAVGGYVTHCGWNSCLESVCAGVPMITWPLFGDQAMNEKLVVAVLKVGVSVGVKVCSFKEEERTFVKREEIMRAVEELMGSGEEVEKRRERVQELAESAKRANQVGGSSYQDMTDLIEKLMELKTRSREVNSC